MSLLFQRQRDHWPAHWGRGVHAPSVGCVVRGWHLRACDDLSGRGPRGSTFEDSGQRGAHRRRPGSGGPDDLPVHRANFVVSPRRRLLSVDPSPCEHGCKSILGRCRCQLRRDRAFKQVGLGPARVRSGSGSNVRRLFGTSGQARIAALPLRSLTCQFQTFAGVNIPGFWRYPAGL